MSKKVHVCKNVHGKTQPIWEFDTVKFALSQSSKCPHCGMNINELAYDLCHETIDAMTPDSAGIEKGTIVKPSKGWKPQTYYVCDVAFTATNVIHRCILFTGFLDDSGNPKGSYAALFNPSWEENTNKPSDAYFLRVIRELFTQEELDEEL